MARAKSSPAPTGNAGKGALGCLGLLLLCGLVAWITNIGGCGGATTHQVQNASGLMSKAEWRKKLESHYGQYARMNIVYQWKANEFKQFMGNPTSTQTVGDQVFWYYECSDGQVQLCMDQGNLAIGIMAGNINDY